MVIIGRIYDIVHTSEKSAQIVLRKKVNNKVVPVAITVFGYWRDKAINEMKLKPKDKIKANLYLKSKAWNGKYFTDVFFKEIYLVEPAPVSMPNLFTDKSTLIEDDGFTIDITSGEIVVSE